MTDARLPRPPRARLPARPGRRRFSWTWLGLVPFFALRGPVPAHPDAATSSSAASRTTPASFTLQNYVDLGSPQSATRSSTASRSASSPRSSAASSASCWRTRSSRGGLPGPFRGGLLTFSGVASNFAGVPLALAFIFTLGRVGLLTVLLKNVFGIDIYDNGFTLYSKLGLEIVYLYFQFPLMVLIMAPAIDGLKREWREAAENMGGSSAPVLALRRPADPDADDPRHDDPAVRERVRGAGDRLPADRRRAPDRHPACSSAPDAR